MKISTIKILVLTLALVSFGVVGCVSVHKDDHYDHPDHYDHDHPDHFDHPDHPDHP